MDKVAPPLSAATISARLRRQQQQDEKTKSKTTSSGMAVRVTSLDDDIARLEAQLLAGSGSDGSDSEDSYSGSEVSYDGATGENGKGVVAIKNESGEVLILKSAIDEDRIQKLPSHLLPLPHCSKGGKGAPREASRVRFQPPTAEGANLTGQKRVRISEEGAVSIPAKSVPRPTVSAMKPTGPSGLAKTVQEMMRSYVPASLEKKAFYCRACKHEASCEEEFFAHKETQAHRELAEVERKASFCRLCRKQFTSPEQIKEHLKGKAHKQKMEATSRNNGQGSKTRDGVKLERI